MRTKHAPIRTCLGCGRKLGKGELVRIGVKDAMPVLDESGRLHGRGAYICPRSECINLLLRKKGRLSHALRIFLPREAEEGFLKGLLREKKGED